MTQARLTVTRAEDSSTVINALQQAKIPYVPRMSESEPATILEVEGRQYIGAIDILRAIDTDLTDLHEGGRGRSCSIV